jgi:tetratricopeptide (TPR) repeat protein
VDKQKNHVVIVLSAALLLGIAMVANRWKSSLSALGPVPQAMNKPAMGPVSRDAFLSVLFEDIKPPVHIGRILALDAKNAAEDSLQAVIQWAMEAGIEPLAIMAEADLAEKNPTRDNLTAAARNLVFGGAQYHDIPMVSNYLFQRGKTFIDKGLAMDSANVPLRNAWITYLSEYENEPMKFLSVLRPTLAIDSNNIETHFIHLNLLRKSSQWKKAIAKCEKLISLQPQNPVWLFQTSEIYGYMGDSLNAKTYLELAKKAQKQQAIKP